MEQKSGMTLSGHEFYSVFATLADIKSPEYPIAYPLIGISGYAIIPER